MNSSCQSVYYGFGNALGAGRVTECNLVGGTQPIPQGVNQDFLAAIPDPPKPVVAVNIFFSALQRHYTSRSNAHQTSTDSNGSDG